MFLFKILYFQTFSEFIQYSGFFPSKIYWSPLIPQSYLLLKSWNPVRMFKELTARLSSRLFMETMQKNCQESCKTIIHINGKCLFVLSLTRICPNMYEKFSSVYMNLIQIHWEVGSVFKKNSNISNFSNWSTSIWDWRNRMGWIWSFNKNFLRRQQWETSNKFIKNCLF